MGAPTYNDQTFVEGLSVKKKAQLMYRYLVRGDNMTEAGEGIDLEGQSASMTTSAVMRVYGFEGRNSGVLMGYGATYDDILATVQHFPHGCKWDGGAEFKDYVRNTIKKRNEKAAAKAPKPAPSIQSPRPVQPVSPVQPVEPSIIPKPDLTGAGHTSNPQPSFIPKPDLTVPDSVSAYKDPFPEYAVPPTPIREPKQYTMLDDPAFWGFLAFIVSIPGFIITGKILKYFGVIGFWKFLLWLPVWFVVTLVIGKVVAFIIRRIFHDY